MKYTFYRGDTRKPSELRGGFKARVPLSVQQARDLVERFITSTSKISLPIQKKDLQDTLNQGKAYKLMDLVRMIKIEKNQTTVHISTDLSEDCGGYSSGYIYEIVFDDLNYLDKNKVLTTEPESLQCSSHFNTYVVIDTKSLATASVVALSSKGDEVSFLTDIPYANIKRYKRPREQNWNDMPP